MKIDRLRDEKAIEDKVLLINRVSKTVTGGRVMSFSAFVAAGDRQGSVGIGLGKAKSVSDAVKKGSSLAKKTIDKFSTSDTTIPHEVMGKFGATQVFMKPAPKGTGLVAGSVVRDILDLLGVKDVFTKVYGSKNRVNVAKATMDAISQLRTYAQVTMMRAKKL